MHKPTLLARLSSRTAFGGPPAAIRDNPRSRRASSGSFDCVWHLATLQGGDPRWIWTVGADPE